MRDVTSVFSGFTTPLATLYDEIHQRGWQVNKVDYQSAPDAYVAQVQNPYGESVEKVGPDAQTALAAALMHIVRKEHIRTAAWGSLFTDRLEEIAQAYAKAPVFDPKAAAAWKELADDSVARFQQLQKQLHIEVVNDPEPYKTPQEMCKDVHEKKHFLVSRANSDHPVWTVEQNVAFRTVHDVLGHCVAGGDFGWTGENLACAAHFPLLSPNAQKALFVECIGQTAYGAYYRSFGPQKVCFLDEFLEPTQAKENPDGHMGEPYQNSLAPSAMPQITPSEPVGLPWQTVPPHLNTVPVLAAHMPAYQPGRHGKGVILDGGEVRTWNTQGERGAPYHADYGYDARNPNHRAFIINPSGEVSVYAQPQDNLRTLHTQIQRAQPDLRAHPAQFSEMHWGKTAAGIKRDPNWNYDTGVEPLPQNAYLNYGDPLQLPKLKEHAHKLDTGWSNFRHPNGEPDFERMKQAVTNALRAAMLSPLKNLKWNAAHYQDISHIPHNQTDPKVYWDALENARVHHNRSLGLPDPEIRHKAHYKSMLDFYSFYQRHHPGMSPSEAKEKADRQLHIMQAEEENRLMRESKDPDMDVFEPKVFKALDKRLKQLMKDEKIPRIAAKEINPLMQRSGGPELYGGFIGLHLIAIARLGKHIDYITEAALEDVKRHDGSGHHFRASLLSLGIPYVGAKVASFAWLLLQPLTSQLATMDTHMCDVLGYKHDDVLKSNVRDYFRLERELKAGRDAAGYDHIPLGQFQWGMWDLKRSGLGAHQDHSPLKAWNPQPHHTMEWQPSVSVKVKGDKWIPPEWWEHTKPYREAEVAKWNQNVAPGCSKKRIPWQEQPLPAGLMVVASESPDELHLALDVPERIRLRIAEWLTDLDVPEEDLTPPEEWHVTVAYADEGVNTPGITHVLRQFNLTGLPFSLKGLTKFPSQGDKSALVLELENPHFDEYATVINEWLQERGIETSTYPDGYKPHITIAYTNADPKPDRLPPIQFRTPGMSFSTPRGAPQLTPLYASVDDLVAFDFAITPHTARL